MLLGIVLLVILGAAVACLWNRGMWTGMLTLINTVFAALLAMNYFQAAANLFGKDSGSNMLDFVCFWGSFIVFSTLLRVVSDLTSRVRVRFPYPVDLAGAVLLSLSTGWVVLCFAVTSLHVSPLERTLFQGFIFGDALKIMRTPDEQLLGKSDRLWLAFTRQVSLGAFKNSDEGFDPQGEFVFKYAARRETAKKPAKSH
jgi:hypothetical protein